MKTITYRATYQTPNDVVHERFTVYTRSINSGFAKAIKLATSGLPKSHELTSIEFWEVQ